MQLLIGVQISFIGGNIDIFFFINKVILEFLLPIRNKYGERYTTIELYKDAFITRDWTNLNPIPCLEVTLDWTKQSGRTLF